MEDVNVSEEMGAANKNVTMRVEDGKLKIINLKKCRYFPPSRLDCGVCKQYCYTGAIKVY